MNPQRIAVTVITASMLSLPFAVFAYPGSQYEKNAKITLSQARAKAVKAVPGTIQSAELEKEPGGSGLRYSFDIKTPNGALHEVGVDAQSGNVIENNHESAKAEADKQRHRLNPQPPY